MVPISLQYSNPKSATFAAQSLLISKQGTAGGWVGGGCDVTGSDVPNKLNATNIENGDMVGKFKTKTEGNINARYQIYPS